MNSADITVGSEWVSGNTFYPTHETVLSVNISWGMLTEKERASERACCWWDSEEQHAVKCFVRYRTDRTPRGKSYVTTKSVFAATRYVDNDAMIAAYEAKRAAA